MAQDFSNHPLSYEEYAAIDDGRRYQVIEGELVMTPSPRRSHQRAVPYLWRQLDDYARATGAGEAFLAPFDVVMRAERPAVVVQPDVLFVAADRATIITDANVEGPPDIVVEVLSPSNARLDFITKRRIYAEYNVPEYWIVDVDSEQIQVFTLGTDKQYGKPALHEPGDRLTSPRLPGFELDVAELFARVSRS